jgi:hypothetical protein
MSAIGGFLPEITSGAEPYPLTRLRSRRPRVLARHSPHVRPRRVLPFYVCDAVLQPLAATGTPFEFYASPAILSGQRPRSAPGELMLIVNYFGC